MSCEDRKERFLGFLQRVLLLSLGILFSIPTGGLALLPDEEVNARIYKEFSPGVVNITTVVVNYDFFLSPVPGAGTGSGSIIDKQGHILTNDHVVEKANQIQVTLADGGKFPARLIGADADSDLAVIKIDVPPERLTVVPIGTSSDLVVGQKVLAIGNPFGLDRTLTVGIISSLGRSIRAQNGRLIRGIIQTDAAINPGNSGGPLLDTSGGMIGVNSAIFTPSGGNIGIGFAIPADEARKVVPQLIAKGYVSRAWLGIAGQNITPEIAKALNLPVSRGILIAQVVKGSPAEKAGLRGGRRPMQLFHQRLIIGGDLIIRIEGKEIEGTEALTDLIESKNPGDALHLTILRDGEHHDMTVTLEEWARRE
jgi:putative serine protease PepD